VLVQQTGDVASGIKVYGVKRQLYRRVTSLFQDQTRMSTPATLVWSKRQR